MTDTRETDRPVPRWLHAWAVGCVAATFLMLLVGQLVTSFRAGMADPVWPTEPWYLFSNYKLDFGYLIEHGHRILGWVLGGAAVVLAVGLWWVRSPAGVRWAGLAGLAVLLAGYGEFHRGLIAQRDVPAAQVSIPTGPLGAVLGGAAVVLALAASGLASGARGAGVRLLGLLALLAVMVQGLLGGFRVKLNELVGTDLAAVHGVFAQVVFGLLVTVAVLTAAPPPPARPARRVARGAVLLAVLLFVQVVWGAIVRHDPTPLAQRLHFLTAFAATGVAVWVLAAVTHDPAAKSRVRSAGHLLGGLLALQLVLGVEAWMEKFGAYTLPELVPVTKTNAAVRTLHALVGSALLATAVGLAVRLGQRAGAPGARDAGGWSEHGERAGRELAAVRGDAT
jgi:heme A synthase